MSRERPSVALFLDSPDENWRAMDLAGEMLFREWKKAHFASEVDPLALTIDLPRIARRVERFSATRRAFNADRFAGRFVVYPAYAAQQRRKFDFFHVVDHTYAHLVNVLPQARTGVYCHDLDAFRSLLERERDPRPVWFRALQSLSLRGMRAASVVFYSTNVVRAEIERTGAVPASRLVQAPFGISPEFSDGARDSEIADEILAPLAGRPFLLHVGSAAARKRLDVLFETFARLRRTHPELRFVQHGAALSDAQVAMVRDCGIEGSFVRSNARVDRSVLAVLYRRAKAVLVTSDAEGFGIPVIEALACGAVVFASDLPVLREVAGGALIFCPVGEPAAWAESVGAFLDGRLASPSREQRLACASRYTWSNHARTILDAYRALPPIGG